VLVTAVGMGAEERQERRGAGLQEACRYGIIFLQYYYRQK